MVAQRSELLDGTEVPLFAGVFAIFGHGNVLGLGTALYDVRDELPTWRGQNEQGMALAAVGFARATDRRQVMAATSLGRPGRAQHGHRGRAGPRQPAAGAAAARRHVHRPRRPTRCCSRSSTSATRPRRVNDAFRAVSRYFDRITRPEQLLATLPQVARVLTDPADAGPVVLACRRTCRPRSTTSRWRCSRPRVHRVPRPRPDVAVARRGGRDPALGAASAARRRRRRALLRCRPRRCSSCADGARRAGRRDGRRPHPACPHDAPAATAAPLGHHRLDLGQHPGRRGRRRAGGRHPAAGLHHRLVDAVRARRARSSRSTPPASTPSSTARTPWSATRGETSRELARGARRAGRPTRSGPRGRRARGPRWDAHIDRLRAGVAPDGSLTYAQVVGVVNDASGPDDYVLAVLRRHARRAARRLAQRPVDTHGRGAHDLGRDDGPRVRLLVHGLRDRGAVGRRDGPGADPPGRARHRRCSATAPT